MFPQDKYVNETFFSELFVRRSLPGPPLWPSGAGGGMVSVEIFRENFFSPTTVAAGAKRNPNAVVTTGTKWAAKNWIYRFFSYFHMSQE